MNTPQSPLPNEACSGGPALSVPGLLNILYRGRLVILVLTLLGLAAGLTYGIVTKPLYLATAQVRPGIVSYSPAGGPVREWALKDVVRWFRSGLYWLDMREIEAFKDFDGPPDIMAEFIPSGPQYMQGGDVITLRNLHNDPQVAMATLDAAITSFNHQAGLDSLGSTMHLTMGGIRVRMAKIAENIKQIRSEEERVRLQITEEEANLTMVALRDQEVSAELERLASENAWRTRAAEAARQQAGEARGRLLEARQLLEAIVETETADAQASVPAQADPVSGFVLRAVSREQAGNVGDLLLTVDQLSRASFQNEVMADSLTTRVRANELAMDRLKLEREIALAKMRSDLDRKIKGLNLQLEYDLPSKQAQLQNDWEGEKVLLDLISPLERIGNISVTEKPIRPRKLRATAILTLLAFAGSLFLVLFREYFRNNRAAILAAKDS